MILTFFHKSLHSLPDEELMARVAANDDDRAYDELYHRHSRHLMGMLWGLLHNDEERAADLTQDTFLRVWSSRSNFHKDKSFRTWLYSIAYNLVKNEYRHEEYHEEYEQHITSTEKEDEENDFDIKLDGEAFDEALKKELSLLPPEKMMLFALRFEEEMAVPQIAEVMEIAEGTVKSRLHNLIKTLKIKLKQYE